MDPLARFLYKCRIKGRPVNTPTSASAGEAAVEQAAPEGELKERMEWWRARWDKECADVAAAHAAIREAAIVRLANHSVLLCAPPNLCETCQWLALPAVVAAREEEEE